MLWARTGIAGVVSAINLVIHSGAVGAKRARETKPTHMQKIHSHHQHCDICAEHPSSRLRCIWLRWRNCWGSRAPGRWGLPVARPEWAMTGRRSTRPTRAPSQRRKRRQMGVQASTHCRPFNCTARSLSGSRLGQRLSCRNLPHGHQRLPTPRDGSSWWRPFQSRSECWARGPLITVPARRPSLATCFGLRSALAASDCDRQLASCSGYTWEWKALSTSNPSIGYVFISLVPYIDDNRCLAAQVRGCGAAWHPQPGHLWRRDDAKGSVRA